MVLLRRDDAVAAVVEDGPTVQPVGFVKEHRVDARFSSELAPDLVHKPVHRLWVREIPERAGHVVAFPAYLLCLRIVEEHLRVARVVKRRGGDAPVILSDFHVPVYEGCLRLVRRVRPRELPKGGKATRHLRQARLLLIDGPVR